MPINSIPVLIPGVLYTFVSKPLYHTKTTVFAVFKRHEERNYVFELKTIQEADVLFTPKAGFESKFPREELSLTFFVTENERTSKKKYV